MVEKEKTREDSQELETEMIVKKKVVGVPFFVCLFKFFKVLLLLQVVGSKVLHSV